MTNPTDPRGEDDFNATARLNNENAGLRRELLDVTAQRDDAQKRAEEYRAGWKLRGRQLNESDQARYAAEGALVAARTENAGVRMARDFHAADAEVWMGRALTAEAALAVARRDGACAALDAVADIVRFEAGPGDVYMRADVLSVIAQVRPGRASMLATQEPPDTAGANETGTSGAGPDPQIEAHHSRVGATPEPLPPELLLADPELMASPEGDKRGLKELKDRAQDRIDQLAVGATPEKPTP